MPIRPAIPLGIIAALVTACTMLPAASSDAAVRIFPNCAAVHTVYSGGIARKGVTRNRTASGSRALKGEVEFDTALYEANRKSDRDGDGIACELT